MANTQTTVPIFVAAQVLEAAQLNNSAATGVPVFATTVTRDAGFGGAGEKTLAEGQLCYLESTNVVQYYDGAAWATLGPAPAVSSGLVFITGGSISSTATSVDNCFSSTYLNYKIVLNDLVVSAGSRVRMRLRVSGADNTTSNYSSAVGGIDTTSSTFVVSLGNQNATSFAFTTDTNVGAGLSTSFDLLAPFDTNPTHYGPAGVWQTETVLAATSIGVFKATTSFDGITFFPTSPDTMTGTYKIYGYANS
jgi:hypothetical protein